MPKAWTLEDIAWGRFDAGLADPETIRAVKAACLVEHNAVDYVTYLGKVFPDDPAFMAAMQRWGDEEVQHGRALRRWAELADPCWDFAAAFATFNAGFCLPLEVGGGAVVALRRRGRYVLTLQCAARQRTGAGASPSLCENRRR